jgi:hypothetical protein
MDLFIDFVLSYAGFFILSHFLYSISGRRRKIPVIVLSLLLVSSLANFFSYLSFGLTTSQLILYFLATVLPIILAFYTFMIFTGGMSFGKLNLRSRTIKGISPNIQTKRMLNITSYVMISVSIVLGILAGFYQLIFVPLFVLILGIGVYFLYSNQQIVSESVILFIGKNKEKIYEFSIPKEKNKIYVKDFFQNEMYIVDPIGIAIQINSEKKIEKHYLYWIATGDVISVKDMPLKPISKLSYQSFINQYEKYHYRQIYFNVGRLGNAELIKEKVIK